MLFIQTVIIIQGLLDDSRPKEGLDNATSESQEPRQLPLLGISRLGPYKVKEEVEKAPTYDHACNITSSAIRVNFQEGPFSIVVATWYPISL